MEVRGNRECTDCGTRFSYYETGSPACPECGSLRTVGVGERAMHTDRPAELDLTEAIEALEGGRYRDAGQAAEETARQYVRRRGFIHGGELRDLDETYLAANEVLQVAQLLRLLMGPPREEADLDLAYAKRLFEAAADGDWPATETVPEAMAGPRGLAVARAVEAYREALKTWQDADEKSVDAGAFLQRLDDHLRRVRALEGAIEPAMAQQLVEAANAVGEYIRTGTGEAAVESALQALADYS